MHRTELKPWIRKGKMQLQLSGEFLKVIQSRVSSGVGQCRLDLCASEWAVHESMRGGFWERVRIPRNCEVESSADSVGSEAMSRVQVGLNGGTREVAGSRIGLYKIGRQRLPSTEGEIRTVDRSGIGYSRVFEKGVKGGQAGDEGSAYHKTWCGRF